MARACLCQLSRKTLEKSPAPEMVTGLIFDIRRYSIHDGPGIRTTVFFKGCPLACQWCHNPEGISRQPELILHPNRCVRCGACVEACPRGAVSKSAEGPITDRDTCQQCGTCVTACFAEARQMVGRVVTVEQLISEVERDRVFYEQSGGGITISGGEPLAQWEFLLATLAACRVSGIHTVLDTCGFAPWGVLERVYPSVDLFLWDLKMIDDEMHRRFTGVSNALILSNLQKLSERGANITIRIPVIPGINDDEDNLRQTGDFLTGLPQSHPVELLPYHDIAASKYIGLGKEYPHGRTLPPDADRIKAITSTLEKYPLKIIRTT
jgi:pyruvate formate lyase activating enzyme